MIIYINGRGMNAPELKAYISELEAENEELKRYLREAISGFRKLGVSLNDDGECDGDCLIERAVNGVVYCEECGQPILRPYDCIAHHVIELNEDNVDDVSISLNQNNVKLVHFKCHNLIHILPDKQSRQLLEVGIRGQSPRSYRRGR